MQKSNLHDLLGRQGLRLELMVFKNLIAVGVFMSKMPFDRVRAFHPPQPCLKGRLLLRSYPGLQLLSASFD
jgi:hypothetical protein